MSVSVMRRATVVAGSMLLGVAIAAVVTAPPSSADATCTGVTDTWLGGGGATWSTGTAWSTGAEPGQNDTALIPAGAAVEVTVPPSICGLQVGAGATLMLDRGLKLDASGPVVVAGGTSANPTTLTTSTGSGDTGELKAGSLDIQAGNGGNVVDHVPVLTAENSTVGAGVRLTTGDISTGVLAEGLLTLGSGSVLTSDITDAANEGQVGAVDSIALTGNATIDGILVGVAGKTKVETQGHTLAVTDGGILELGAGSAITSASGRGDVVADNGGVALNGAASVGTHATLRVSGRGALTDAVTLLGAGSASASLAGPGTFNWLSGSVAGHVTLKAGLNVTLTGRGSRVVDDFGSKTVLVNKSAKFSLAGGTLVEADAKTTFENAGVLTQTAGVADAAGASAPPIINAKGATWLFKQAAGTTVAAHGSLINNGNVDLAAGVHVKFDKAYKQASTGSLELGIAGAAAKARAAVAAKTVTLGGTLRLISAPKYKPKAGVKLVVVTGARTHTFAKVQSTTHRSGTTWTVSYATKYVDAVLKAKK